MVAIQRSTDFGGAQAAVPDAQIADGAVPIVGLVGAVADAVIAPDTQPRAGDGIAELAGAHVHPIDIEGAVGGAGAALDQGVLVPAAIAGHGAGDGPEIADAQIATAGLFDRNALIGGTAALGNDCVGVAVACCRDGAIGLGPHGECPIARHRHRRPKGFDVVIHPIEV